MFPSVHRGLVVSLLLVSFLQGACVRDENISCREWAEVDLECSKNPRFMWGSCQRSCLTAAQDEHEECRQWAQEGECSANPRYVPIHCPVACEYAIAWNTWLRSQLEIDSMNTGGVGDYSELCHVPMDILGAAELMRQRLHHFIIEANPFTVGITNNGPGGEFNGLVGLAEGVLYSLRLYIKVIEKMSLTNPDDGELSILLHDANARLQDVLSVMTPPTSWNKDALMIMVPRWTSMLSDLSRRVLEQTSHGASGQNNNESQQSKIECPTFYDYDDFATLIPSEMTFAPDMASSHINSNEESTELKTLTLANGVKLPVMGLGTWILNGDECTDTVTEAIKIGYRHIDGAEAYGNDKEIGIAIQRAIGEGIVDRKDLFIANKISDPNNAGYQGTKKLVKRQLQVMGLEYFDLYMIHSPMQDHRLMEATWQALQELYQEGILRSIGLSNFGSRDLELLLSFPSLVTKPMVIQNKMDIYHVGKQIDVDGDNIVSLMKRHDIRMVAYSSLSSFPFSLQPVDDPVIRYVAHTKPAPDDVEYKEAIVVLRWILQQGMAVIPRTANLNKLASNMQAASNWCALEEREMKIISSIAHLIGSPVSVPVIY